MKKIILQITALCLFLSLPVLFMTGCYNDSKEYLYPTEPGICDTANVTYSGCVKPIIDGNCKTCHSGAAPSADLNLENYAQTKIIVDDGRLVNVINGSNGYQIMPPQGGSLPVLDITIIEKWVAAGAPNN